MRAFGLAKAVFTAALVGLTTAGFADEWNDRFGNYATGMAGVSSPTSGGDLETRDAAQSRESFDYELDDGLIGSGAAGIYQGPLRGEFEIAYHSNDVNSLEGDFAAGTPAEGDMTALSFMLNGFYDLRIVEPITLYLGGGVGFAAIDFDAETVSSLGTRYEVNADSAAICWQVMAGFDVEIVDRVHALIGYRAWMPLDADVEVTSQTGGSNVSARSSGDDLGLPVIHSVEVGLRIDL